jgi:hypothetical protein
MYKWLLARRITYYLLAAAGILIASCETLNEDRAIELVRLNYRQQSEMEGAGKWIVGSVSIINISKIPGDTLTYAVVAAAEGFYRYDALEDTPEGYTEQFYDTVQFVARNIQKVWIADDWTVIGSKHE